MAKPMPTVLTEITQNDRQIQILEVEKTWTVSYKGQPFSLKIDFPKTAAKFYPPRYPKVCFAHPGHARNLAKKLNGLFQTEDFFAVEIK